MGLLATVMPHEHGRSQSGHAESMPRPSARHERQHQVACEPIIRYEVAAVHHTQHHGDDGCHEHPSHVAPAYQVGYCRDEIAPSDESEDAPPTGLEMHARDVAPHDDAQQHRPTDGLEHIHHKGFPSQCSALVSGPYQEESGYHQQREREIGHAARARADIESEQSHHDKGETAPKDVAQHAKLRLTLSQTVVDGEGHRHSHTEEEGRENGVGKAQHILIGGGMEEPVGHAFQTGNVVDEQHQHHGDGPDGIDTRHS